MGPKFQSYGKDLPCDLLAKVMARRHGSTLRLLKVAPVVKTIFQPQ
jgi:hypothetical protein